MGVPGGIFSRSLAVEALVFHILSGVLQEQQCGQSVSEGNEKK